MAGDQEVGFEISHFLFRLVISCLFICFLCIILLLCIS